MHYIITGGSGFIGSNLRNLLTIKKVTYTVVDKVTQNPLAVNCDILDKFPSVNGDKLVHLAAETNVRDSLKKPSTYILNNCKGLLNALTRAREDKIKEFIFTSSASAQLSESPYLASKAACESICKAYKNSFYMNIKVLKLSSVYGPYSAHKESIIHKFIKSAIRHEPLAIYGDGTQMRDFIYVEDVAKAIFEGKEGFISTGSLTSINTIAVIIANFAEELIGYKPKIKYINAVPGEVHRPAACSDLSDYTFLNEGIFQTFKWYRENYGY